MARTRDIKPGFFKNEELGELPPLARLFFAGLWCWSDREGRFEDRPKKLKADILGYDNCDGEELMQLLADRGFVIRYEVNGKRYGQIVNFNIHQSPHPKEAGSIIPAPVKQVSSTLQAGDNTPATQGDETEQPGTSPSIPSFPSIPSLDDPDARAGEEVPPEERGEEAIVTEVFTILQNKFGIINFNDKDKILDIIDNYPRDWIVRAIDIALEYKARRISYVDSVLKGWRDKGFEDWQKPWESDNHGKRNRAGPGKGKAGIRPSEVDWEAERDNAL